MLSLCSFALPNWISATSIQRSAATTNTHNGSYLSPKNLQVLKALFNIAHGLGSILGSGWHIVLETFEQLDYVVFINSQRRNLHRLAHDGGSSVGAGSNTELARSYEDPSSIIRGIPDDMYSNPNVLEDDERVVIDLLKSLFESTKFIEDDALQQVIISLSELCFTTLAHAWKSSFRWS